MDTKNVADWPKVFTFVDFADGPTGYIEVDSVDDGPTAYIYMPLRNGPHYEFAKTMHDQGQTEVSVRLKSGAVVMIAIALSSRSITLAARASA